MSPEVQDDVVALAGRMLDASGAKDVDVSWFGGEPLLALHARIGEGKDEKKTA